MLIRSYDPGGQFMPESRSELYTAFGLILFNATSIYTMERDGCRDEYAVNVPVRLTQGEVMNNHDLLPVLIKEMNATAG